MSLITEYVILRTETPIHLEQVVKGAIEDGFQPLGAPFFGDSGWSQAVVKRTVCKEIRAQRSR